jgi:hypothetical protein
MLTEFGIVNPQHPHEWHWLDQPVINTRLLGGEGTRGVGLRLGWLTPLPWFSQVHVGVQMANDETMVSFLGGEDSQSPGGFERSERDVESFKEFLYLLRWHNRVEAGTVSFDIGVSGLAGPNASGDRGASWILGGDSALNWKNEIGARFTVQGEVMYRYFQANGGVVDGAPVEPATLGDWGGYLCVLGSPIQNWSFGVRGEWADGREQGTQPRAADSLRDRRLRLSPLVQWQCCELARVRLQYNFDHVQHLKESTAHGVWLRIEIEFGTHHHHE